MLLAPAALLLTALAAPIILLYVLKLRRREAVVPSTFLWRQVLEDIQANAPWQRLRFNLLLLLQLLTLAALILALARPAYSESHAIAGDLIVIVDESYGMQAHDVPPSRFAAALARARTLASQLAPNHRMSVIGMGARPRLAIAASSDQGAIARAIGRLRVGTAAPNFLDALSLAASLARSGQAAQVVVLTSRQSGITSLPLQVHFPVEIDRIGQQLHDLGITALAASRHGQTVEAVARIGNFGAQTERSRLELFANGRLADVRSLAVPAHGQRSLFWTDLPAMVTRLHLRLLHRDDVDNDKSAWAVIPGPPIVRVLLVSHGDFFLQAALLDDPATRPAITSPAAYRPAMSHPYDLTIFDGFLPRVLPAGSVLLVNPPQGTAGALRFRKNRPGGTVTETAAGMSGPLGSLLRYVDLSDVHVAQVRSVSLPDWLHPLALSAGYPLLAAGESGRGRLALVGFDLQHSDWPLRISFPLAIHNLVRYLAPGLTLGASAVTVGQPVQLFPPPNTRFLDVRGPAGLHAVVHPPFPPFAGTERAGVYTIRPISPSAASLENSFAVNFFPARPAPAAGPAVVQLGHGRPHQTLHASAPVPIDRAFILLGLALLAAEWWVAFRGLSRV